MEKELLEKYKNRKVKVNLKDGYFYTCQIVCLFSKSLEIKDKYGKHLIIDLDQISKVEVV